MVFSVRYDYPDKESRMYPLYNSENKEILTKYLRHLVKIKNVISIGRLGLFKYYDMDDTIAWCLKNIDAIDSYITLNPEQRMQLLT